MQTPAENRFLHYSLALHIGVALVFLVGLPSIFTRADPQPLVLSVEILPIGAITNVKPSDKPIEQQKTAKAPVNKKPIPKTAAEEQKKPDPVKQKDEVADPDKTEKPEEKPKEKPKPEEKPKTDDFAALISKLKQETSQEKTDPKSKDSEAAEENKTKSDAPYDASLPLSISEKDAIRSQFVQCWHMPAGARDADNLAVRVRISLSADGAVTEVKLATGQSGRYNSDSFFRAAADSAIRAVWKCSPLKYLSPEKYSSWSDMELNFDPQELLY